MMLIRALLLLVEALLALCRILLLALCRILLLTLGKFLLTLSLKRLRLLTLLRLCGLLRLSLILPRLRSLRIEPARLLLVLRTLRLRRPILLSLTAKALL